MYGPAATVAEQAASRLQGSKCEGIVSSQQVRDRSRQSVVFKMLTGLANS